MESDSSIHIDISDSKEETQNKNHAIITTLWGGVSAWREQMLLLATEYASSKQKFKKRNRDLARAEFIKTLINGRDSECISQLRMDTRTFKLLCQSLRDKKLLRDTRQVCVEESVAEFMHTIAHSVRNRTNSVRFFRSGETISRHFQEVLYAINRLAPDYFVQAGPHTPKGPYGFEDCIGAIDGTHVPVHVPTEIHGSFRNRNGVLSQNVLGACGFDMNFQYVLPGWEGSAADSRVLQNALLGEDLLIVPQGKYYLVDAGYANAPGFLAPYRAVRYHLSDFRGMNPQNEKELFNKRHSQARNVIERTFGVLKNRFGILKTATQYEYRDQVSIVVACCVMHNFIRAHCGDSLDGLEDTMEDDNEVNTDSNDYDDDILLQTAMSPKKKNVTFNAPMDDELLDLMYEQVLLGRKADRGFKMDAYKHVADAMTEHSDGAYILTSQAIQNRCKHLKRNYAIVTEMLNASGFGYDNATKRIIASDDVWADWIQGHPKAQPYKNSKIDYDKLTTCFGKDVATGQYARSATTAPSRQSTESGAANFTPANVDSDVGLTDQLGGCRIQSSGGEASSRRTNGRKRNSELLEIISCIERSSEGLQTAIRDVADCIRMPKKQHATFILTELRGFPNLNSLDVELAHEWLTVHQDMATVFITADNKEEWIMRQMPRIRAERL